jgi:hypothetical protein
MSKQLSLYGVKLKDALRVALNTPLPPEGTKPKPKKKAAKKKAAHKG